MRNKIKKLLADKNINLVLPEMSFRLNQNELLLEDIYNVFKIRLNIAIENKNEESEKQIRKLLVDLKSYLHKTDTLRILIVKDKSEFYNLYVDSNLNFIIGFIKGKIGENQ